MSAWYNEIDPYAAQWLRNLIAGGHIAPGVVDERSIVDVRPADLAGFDQCHFFAGLGGWSYAARLAGWPDKRALWTGSCPCQPFSVAGKGEGHEDARHLWPEFLRLIAACQPPVVMGEQVAAAVGKGWLDRVCSDMEELGYAIGAAVVPACAVNKPHRRDRLWFVAYADSAGVRDEPRRIVGADWPCSRIDRNDCESSLANADQPSTSEEREQRGGQLSRPGGDPSPSALEDAEFGRRQRGLSAWDGPGSTMPSGEGHWLAGADGKARRVEPGIRLLAHGVPSRVAKLRALGNAIVPQVAAEIIGAFLEAQVHMNLQIEKGNSVPEEENNYESAS